VLGGGVRGPRGRGREAAIGRWWSGGDVWAAVVSGRDAASRDQEATGQVSNEEVAAAVCANEREEGNEE
jgi:hypothetical protein